MSYQEMLGVRLDPEQAVEILAEIAVLARVTEDPGPEIDRHHFHSWAELFGYKTEGILAKAGLFGTKTEQRRLKET